MIINSTCPQPYHSSADYADITGTLRMIAKEISWISLTQGGRIVTLIDEGYTSFNFVRKRCSSVVELRLIT